MESFKSQLKQVLRRLGLAPMFTAITLVTLAAGVGANTVVFSVLEGVLLKPLPYPKPDELVGVWITAPGIQLKDAELSPSDYFIYREQNRTLQDIGLYQGDSVSVTGVAEPEQVPALRVTDGTLPLLGIPPLLGRGFSKQDDSPGAPETVMLTYGYWRQVWRRLLRDWPQQDSPRQFQLRRSRQTQARRHPRAGQRRRCSHASRRYDFVSRSARFRPQAL